MFLGLTEAWRRRGWPAAEFRLDGRLARAHDWFTWLRERRLADEPGAAIPAATDAEIVEQALVGLVERALVQRCEGLLVITGAFVSVPLLDAARRAGLGVWLVCTESPYELPMEGRVAAWADHVWTNERTAVPALEAVALGTAAYLPHGWRRGVHDVRERPGDEQVPAHDVVFVGSFFPSRVAVLEAVDWRGLDVGFYGMTGLIPADSPLRAFVRGELVGNETAAALYRRAKVGLNLYRAVPDGGVAESLNPRAYELAAAGCCVQVSEPRAEVSEIFGDAVATAAGPAALEFEVRRLIDRPGLRREMADAARATVRDHSWDARVDVVQAGLSGGRGACA